MAETDRYTSRCPVCDGLLDLDEEIGYSCPHCGWNESFELHEDDVWVIPDEHSDEESPD